MISRFVAACLHRRWLVLAVIAKEISSILRYRTLVPRGLKHARAVLTLTEATAVEVRERYGHERVMVGARSRHDHRIRAGPFPSGLDMSRRQPCSSQTRRKRRM